MHLVAGRPLQIFTENEETERWIEENLVNNARELYCEESESLEHNEGGFEESNLGLLLGLDGDVKVCRGGPRITELLLFASISRIVAPALEGLLTPPQSSSPNLQDTRPFITTRHAKIYALPLSSDLCYNPAFFTEPPTPPPEENSQSSQGRFLPPVDFSTISRANSRKRQRLDSLFEDATQQNKRSRRKGGEAVSKLIASVEQLPVPTTDSQRAPEMIVRKRPKPLPGLGLARSQSLGSLRDFEEARPLSRGNGGALARTKRSSLNRVASSSSPAPENGIEAQNKNALSRVVMAGMRMYGLQQRKRTNTLSRAASEIPVFAGDNGTAGAIHSQQDGEEDEYKLIYHQTFKSSAFVFRRQIGSIALGQDVLRDTVDKFLALFCSDSMQESAPDSSQILGDGRDAGIRIFDSPSNGAIVAGVTPVRAKKGG